MDRMIDLRSDTVTKPSRAMREAMMNAPVGDDVSREDPTINELERRSALLTGKESALFVPSGTFANQLSIMTHIGRGNEVYLSEESHVIQHECGAASILSSAFLRTITPMGDYLTWDEIEPRIRKTDDIHFPVPGLIEIENPLSNGSLVPLEEMIRIKQGAARYGLPVHMDGARVFNAALALGLSVKEIADQTDSLMFCLSKGLTAPVGSILCGTEEFIEKARRNRKIMGGGMRQAGILAAAGLYALDHMIERLADDHARARQLGDAFNSFEEFDVQVSRIKINMIFITIPCLNSVERELAFLSLLKDMGILTYPAENGVFRFVTNNEVSQDDIDYIIASLPEIVDKLNNMICR